MPSMLQIWEKLSDAAGEHAIRLSVLRQPAPREVVERLGSAMGELSDAGVLLGREETDEEAGGWFLDPEFLPMVRSQMTGRMAIEAHRAVGAAYADLARPGEDWTGVERGIEHLHEAGDGNAAWRLVEPLVVWLRDQGRWEQAEALLERCESTGMTGEARAEALALWAQTRSLRGDRSDVVMELAERAKGYATSDENRAFITFQVGMLRRQRREWGEAEVALREALPLLAKVLGPDHADRGIALHTLGDVLLQLGRVIEAEAALREALAVKERGFGPDHVRLCPTLTYLADLLCAQSRHGEGEPLARRALDISRRSLGEDHVGTAQAHYSLARLLIGARSPEAGEAAAQAIAAMERAHGKDNPTTLEVKRILDAMLGEKEPAFPR